MEELLKGDKSFSRNISFSGGDLDVSLELEVNKSTIFIFFVVEKFVEWKMGDQLWAKVVGYFWWSCMVVKDFYEDFYIKMKGESMLFLEL